MAVFCESLSSLNIGPIKKTTGGNGGIRTLESFYTLLAFQASALDHYATFPTQPSFMTLRSIVLVLALVHF